MNRRSLLTHGVVAVLLASAGGCAPAEIEDDTDVGSAASALVMANSLAPAALDATGSYPDALTPAMLAAGPLAPGALSAAALAAIEDPGASGALSRQLLAYTVGCALGPAEAPFTFSWTDASGVSHSERYPGAVGLATDWAGHALGATEQAWVSACLIARVNYYGAVVELSMRGSAAALATTPQEVSAYTYEEGAFWGNVFTASPTAYACDDEPGAAHSKAAERVCATGQDAAGDAVSCGIIQPLGSCAAYCRPRTGSAGQYYPACSATGPAPGTISASAIGLTSPVITVFLREARCPPTPAASRRLPAAAAPSPGAPPAADGWRSTTPSARCTVE
jgi:hypothetical protein